MLKLFRKIFLCLLFFIMTSVTSASAEKISTQEEENTFILDGKIVDSKWAVYFGDDNQNVINITISNNESYDNPIMFYIRENLETKYYTTEFIKKINNEITLKLFEENMNYSNYKNIEVKLLFDEQYQRLTLLSKDLQLLNSKTLSRYDSLNKNLDLISLDDKLLERLYSEKLFRIDGEELEDFNLDNFNYINFTKDTITFILETKFGLNIDEHNFTIEDDIFYLGETLKNIKLQKFKNDKFAVHTINSDSYHIAVNYSPSEDCFYLILDNYDKDIEDYYAYKLSKSNFPTIPSYRKSNDSEIEKIISKPFLINFVGEYYSNSESKLIIDFVDDKNIEIRSDGNKLYKGTYKKKGSTYLIDYKIIYDLDLGIFNNSDESIYKAALDFITVNDKVYVGIFIDVDYDSGYFDISFEDYLYFQNMEYSLPEFSFVAPKDIHYTNAQPGEYNKVISNGILFSDYLLLFNYGNTFSLMLESSDILKGNYTFENGELLLKCKVVLDSEKNIDASLINNLNKDFFKVPEKDVVIKLSLLKANNKLYANLSSEDVNFNSEYDSINNKYYEVENYSANTYLDYYKSKFNTNNFKKLTLDELKSKDSIFRTDYNDELIQINENHIHIIGESKENISDESNYDDYLLSYTFSILEGLSKVNDASIDIIFDSLNIIDLENEKSTNKDVIPQNEINISFYESSLGDLYLYLGNKYFAINSASSESEYDNNEYFLDFIE